MVQKSAEEAGKKRVERNPFFERVRKCLKTNDAKFDAVRKSAETTEKKGGKRQKR